MIKKYEYIFTLEMCINNNILIGITVFLYFEHLVMPLYT